MPPAMPRRLRVADGGYAYHVLNCAVGRMRLFDKEREVNPVVLENPNESRFVTK